MCKMRVVINKLVLGNRELGYEVWSGKDVVEMTSNQIKKLMKEGKKVCGLCIGSNGELELDEKGFFTKDMTVHSHINTYKTMREESMTNLLYVCIGKQEIGSKVRYNCISSRFEQAEFTEADMKAYLKIGIVSGGAKLEGEEIVLASLEYESNSVEEVAKPEEVTKPVEEKTKEEVAKPVEVKATLVNATTSTEKKTASIENKENKAGKK